MKLTPQQLFMPMIIGITSVGAILWYFLSRKDEDEATKRRKTRIETSRQSEIQVKVPRECMPAVIGRGGSVIKEMQHNTETQIKFMEETNVESPDRICIIRGKPESINLAEKMILSIIRNQPVIELYEMKVPQRAIGRIMGRGGDSIKQIQNASSTKVILDAFTPSTDPSSERRFIIKGTSEQIATAVALIEEKIQEENEAREKIESNTRQPRSKVSPRNREEDEAKKPAEMEKIEKVDNSEKVEKVEKVEKIEKTSATSNSTAFNTELVTDLLPIQESNMEIYVSAMESPTEFWVQVYGPGTLALDYLVEQMTEYYDKKESAELHALKKIEPDQMVAAKFNFDDRWYRSEVLSGPEDGEYEVFFVDFGDRATIHKENILELRTDFLSLRLQAIECSLANIKPRGGEWSEKACDRFADLTNLAQWKRLYAKVKGYKERVVRCGRTRREGSPIPNIVIFDIINNKEVDIGKALINEDLADSEEDVLSAASSTISVSKRNPDNRKSPTPTSRKTPEKNTKTIQEIDLTTPIKGNKLIEEIDLVSPTTNQSSQFIKNERSFAENGSGDHSKVNKNFKTRPPVRILPGGEESDLSDDSDFDLE